MLGLLVVAKLISRKYYSYISLINEFSIKTCLRISIGIISH